jgi:hypothetical protein
MMLRSVSTRLTGLTIVLVAIWAGLIPFVGPYFHFTLGPDHTWAWTSTRLYMDVLPAAAAFLGGLILLGAGPWAAGRLGAILALLGGIWLAVGPQLSALWHTGGAEGAAHGSVRVQQMERLGLHSGPGVVIAALAGFALPGLLAAYRVRRDTRAGDTAAAGTTATAAGTATAGRTAPADTTTAPAEPGTAEAPTRVTAPGERYPITGRPKVASGETAPAQTGGTAPAQTGGTAPAGAEEAAPTAPERVVP